MTAKTIKTAAAGNKAEVASLSRASVAAKAPAIATDSAMPLKPDPVLLAEAIVTTELNSAVVVHAYSKPMGERDLAALLRALTEDTAQVQAGDMTRAEAMLLGQAHSLQAIFTNLATRAEKASLMAHWESYLRMALKAQNQCRMTLETLATIKNPPVVYAKQANINNGGQQQVNNAPAPGGATVRAGARATNTVSAQSGLLEASDGERLDTRATGAAGRTDPHLEAVGAIDRPAHGQGQGPNGAQR